MSETKGIIAGIKNRIDAKNKLKKNKHLDKEDRYELMRTVQVADIKGILEQEYQRSKVQEEKILELNNQIIELKKTEMSYHAMLVVQEQTAKRTERLQETIDNLLKERNDLTEKIKVQDAKMFDIRLNAEKKLKERDAKIRELRKQVKEKGGGKK